MHRRFASLGLVVLLAACGAHPAGNGSPDAGPQFVEKATHHQSYVPASEHPTTADQLIVAGDSISAGYGASDPGRLPYYQLLRSNDDAQWPAETNTSLDKLFNKDIPPAINVAVPGATTAGLAAQEQALDAKTPIHGTSIVTITIGGNDLLVALLGQEDPTADPLNTAITNIKNFVSFLQDKSKFPDETDIYLMDVYDPTDGVGAAGTCFNGMMAPQFIPGLEAWRKAYIQLGQQMGFAVIDALGHFHGHGFHYNDTTNQYYDAQDPTLWFYTDCIHPNDRGHDELRRLFFEAIDWNYVATP